MGILAVFGGSVRRSFSLRVVSVFGDRTQSFTPLSLPWRLEAAANQLLSLKYVQSFLLTLLAA